MVKCPNCGADIHFKPETQNYVCDFCGSVFEQDELSEEQSKGGIKAEEQAAYEEKAESDVKSEDVGTEEGGYIKVLIYTCPQCGGELFTTEETAATFCSYCGSSVLLERRVSKEMKPEYIIPFQVTKEQAAEIYKKKMNKSLFAPSYMRHMDIEKIRGIYMPYWTYSVFGNANVSVKKTESTPTFGGTKVDEYKINAGICMKGDGIEYDSASSFPDDLSQSIAPYDFKEAKPFTASYMSGFYADAGDVDEEQYFAEAGNVMRVLAAEKAAEELDVAAADVAAQIPEPMAEGKRAMYPVWFVSAKNKAANKVSYAVINGQSGKIAADIPVDNKRLLIGMLCFAVPIFAILYFLITPTPQITTWCVMLLSIVGGIFALVNMKGESTTVKTKMPVGSLVVGIICFVFGIALALLLKEGMFTAVAIFGAVLLIITFVKAAKGNKAAKAAEQQSEVSQKEAEEEKKKKNRYVLPLILCIAAVLVCIIALIWNPVRDIYFYVCVIIAGICSALSYWTMFSIHNKGTLRKLPQLGKRGGDE